MKQSTNLQTSEKGQTDYSRGMLCLKSNCHIWACVVKYRKEMSMGSSKKRLLANINLYFTLKSHLLLWRRETTRDDVVGNSGQGIYWQGSDITHRPDETHWMGGLGTWRHAEGVPHACTARRTLLLEKITWGQVNQARKQMSPP